MKKSLVLLSILFFSLNINTFSQTSEQSIELPCVTEITPQQLDYLQRTESARKAYHHLGNKAVIYIPVQHHIVRRSNGTGGLTAGDIDVIMQTINFYYSNIDLVFYACGPINYIDNDAFFDFSSSQEGTIASTNDVSNVINIYYFNSVTSGGSSVCGYSRFPPSPDRVIMDNSCAMNGSTIVHELGHYFSLYHTHGKTNTGTTDELVNGSNCTFAGDNVCDTPADPNLSGNVSGCTYTGTDTDLNGQSFNPDVTNMMSYAPKACRRTITNGQYNRVAFSVQFDRNYLSCNPPVPVANFSGNTSISCDGKISFYDRSSSLPANWQWDFGDGNTSNLQHPEHHYTSSGTYTVRLTVSNASGTDQEIKTNYIMVDLPNAPVVSPADSICRNESALLNGSSSGTLKWYADSTRSTLLGAGNTYSTDTLSETTTYYAANHLANPVKQAGITSHLSTGGGFLNTNHHLIFDAYKPFSLEEVTVYTNSPGNRTIEIRTAFGFVLTDTTVFIPTGLHAVTLNFNVPAGEDLQLGFSPASHIDLFRSNSAVSYPYQLPGLLNIKGSSAGSSYYYYFYNWKVKEQDCVSAAVPVTVNVKNCGTVGIKEQNSTDLLLYPNPSTGSFTVQKTQEGVLHMQIFNMVGKEVYQAYLSAPVTEISLPSVPSGVYFIKFIQANNIITKKITIR